VSAPEGRFEAQQNANNHFAWMRTQMGLQRWTGMHWDLFGEVQDAAPSD